ncbi:MAG: hypothetical protein ACR2MG_02530 [Pyrinomonadaceae bacterium]
MTPEDLMLSMNVRGRDSIVSVVSRSLDTNRVIKDTNRIINSGFDSVKENFDGRNDWAEVFRFWIKSLEGEQL